MESRYLTHVLCSAFLIVTGMLGCAGHSSDAASTAATLKGGDQADGGKLNGKSHGDQDGTADEDQNADEQGADQDAAVDEDKNADEDQGADEAAAGDNDQGSDETADEAAEDMDDQGKPDGGGGQGKNKDAP